MKTAIIIADRIKQIMLTPETESEKNALSILTNEDNITLEMIKGSLYDETPESARGYHVAKCTGGYLRAYADEPSLMLVLTPKDLKKVDTETSLIIQAEENSVDTINKSIRWDKLAAKVDKYGETDAFATNGLTEQDLINIGEHTASAMGLLNY